MTKRNTQGAVGFLTAIRNEGGSFVHMFSEYIDNTLDSFDKNSKFLNDNPYIKIDIDLKKRFMSISDNCAGILKKDIDKVVAYSNADSNEKVKDAKSMYGVGMKKSSFWFGEGFKIFTKTLDGNSRIIENTESYMGKHNGELVYDYREFGVDEFTQEEKEIIESIKSHGTIINIPGIHNDKDANRCKELTDKQFENIESILKTRYHRLAKDKNTKFKIFFILNTLKGDKKKFEVNEKTIIEKNIDNENTLLERIMKNNKRQSIKKIIDISSLKDLRKTLKENVKMYMHRQSGVSNKEKVIKKLFKIIDSGKYCITDNIKILIDGKERKLKVFVWVQKNDKEFTKKTGFELMQHDRAIVSGPNIDGNKKFFFSNLFNASRSVPQIRISGQIEIPTKVAKPDSNKKGFKPDFYEILTPPTLTFLKESGIWYLAPIIKEMDNPTSPTDDLGKKGSLRSNKQEEITNESNTSANIKNAVWTQNGNLGGTWKDIDVIDIIAPKLDVKVKYNSELHNLFNVKLINEVQKKSAVIEIEINDKHGYWDPNINSGRKSAAVNEIHNEALTFALTWYAIRIRTTQEDSINQESWTELMNGLIG